MQMCHWPQMPTLPPPGEPVLLRLPAPPQRGAARREARTVLRTVLAAWSDLTPQRLPVLETDRGPLWPGELHGATLDISLSYGGGQAWIGLIRDARIGVDVIARESFAEMDDVARLYLGQAAAAKIRRAADPAREFAIAWTQREARLKCARLALAEWDAAEPPAATMTTSIGRHLIASVAVASRGESTINDARRRCWAPANTGTVPLSGTVPFFAHRPQQARSTLQKVACPL